MEKKLSIKVKPVEILLLITQKQYLGVGYKESISTKLTFQLKKIDCDIPTWMVSDGNEMYLLSMTKKFISITDSEGIIIMFTLK